MASSKTDPRAIPEWEGFMQMVCKPVNSEQTTVIPLPFVNNPPSSFDTLYTALGYTVEDSMNLFCDIGQDLYLKAREIVACFIAVSFDQLKTN